MMKTMKNFAMDDVADSSFAQDALNNSNNKQLLKNHNRGSCTSRSEGEWQAIDFRDTLERTFLYTTRDVCPIESTRGFLKMFLLLLLTIEEQG